MTTSILKVTQTVQEWGSDLAIRITQPVAEAANLSRGAPVTVEVEDGILIVRATGCSKPTLEQKLELFDPELHGGEVMAGDRVGAEVF